MFTRITGHASAVVATIVVLTGGAALGGGAATADPNQDDLFKALLNQEDIPALEGVPSLISTAHKICLVLDRGIPVHTVVGAMMNNAYSKDPTERRYPQARLESTMIRFIAASVGAYCPNNQSKIASIVANPAPASYEPTHAAAYLPSAASGLGQRLTSTGAAGQHATALASLIGALPSGDMTPPNPPPIPPPPPAEHLRTPPKLIAAPHAPKRLPPPPQQLPPSPPQQVKPPAVGPQPGSAGGGGGAGIGGSGGGMGGGGTSGGGPVQPPPPAPPMAPGFVRLAP